MDIVDSQIHIGPGGIEPALAAMNALGIQSALIDEYWMGLPADRPGYDIGNGVRRFAAPSAELASLTHPDRFSYVIRVQRLDRELASVIRLARDATHARGLRIIPGLMHGETAALANGAYDQVFALAADNDLPIFVTAPGCAPLLRPYAKKYPAAKIIIDHLGMPFGDAVMKAMAGSELARRPRAVEFEDVLRLADLPNVALKWAHANAMFEVTGYPFEGLRPYLRSALKAFGAERVMWASDVSAIQSGEPWAQLLYWLFDNADLSADERAGLLGGAARKILNWPAWP